jgi:hypothetical protein
MGGWQPETRRVEGNRGGFLGDCATRLAAPGPVAYAVP